MLKISVEERWRMRETMKWLWKGTRKNQNHDGSTQCPTETVTKEEKGGLLGTIKYIYLNLNIYIFMFLQFNTVPTM